MREFDDLPQLMTLLQAQSTLLRYFRHFRHFRLSRVVSASVGALRTAPRFNSHRLRIRRRRLSLLVHSGTTRVSNNDSLFILQSSRDSPKSPNVRTRQHPSQCAPTPVLAG